MKRNGVYQRKDGRWEARYKKGINEAGRAIYGTVYGASEEEVVEKRKELLGTPNAIINDNSLNLLILGAGTHGHDVYEVAKALHIFQHIAFLDDNLEGEGIIGKCKDVLKFKNTYPCAFVAIGNNQIRKRYAKLLKDCNFLIPSIVSPNAHISSNAKIGEGVAILPQATIGEATIEDFCILASNSLVNSKAVVNKYSHIDAGGIVLKETKVPELTKVNSGEVFRK